MIDILLSYLAPHRCYGCGESGSILCESCYDDITSDDFGRCAWCFSPSAHTHQCKSCAREVDVSGTWAVGERNQVLQRLVGNYKYESIHEAAIPLSSMLSDTVALLPSDTVITSVPTIHRHVRQRGFDHAAVLARGFAKQRALPYQTLLRRRHQTAQHDLSKRDRQSAAAEAFTPASDKIPQNILLIDDIMTTGATMRAAVEQLRTHGAQNVYVAVIARQMPDHKKI